MIAVTSEYNTLKHWLSEMCEPKFKWTDMKRSLHKCTVFRKLKIEESSLSSDENITPVPSSFFDVWTREDFLILVRCISIYVQWLLQIPYYCTIFSHALT